MTREAKIGMLTGLGVIVLIGVLLSEYLGDNKLGGGPPSNVATGRLAPLPIGQNFRQQVMQPVGVPPMASNQSSVAVAPQVLAGGNVPPAYATDSQAGSQVLAPTNVTGSLAMSPATPTGPTIGQAVSPVAVGPAPMSDMQLASATDAMGAPPTISVADPVRDLAPVHTATPTGTAVGSTATAPAAGKTYVIAPGDNLAKIAKRFYSTAKESDVKRIVAANPTVLKDEKANLIVGKKLIIPDLPAKAGPAPAKSVSAMAKKTEPVMIYLPGSRTAQSEKADSRTEPKGADAGKDAKKDSGKSYVVKSGDTLEKIARKFAPSNATAFAQKLKQANNLKHPEELQVGQKLKMPI